MVEIWWRGDYIRKGGFIERGIDTKVSRDRKETGRILREESEQ